jgi:hypothetical protein
MTIKQKTIKKVTCFSLAIVSFLISAIFWSPIFYELTALKPLFDIQLFSLGSCLVLLLSSFLALFILYGWKLNGILFSIMIWFMSILGIVTGVLWFIGIVFFWGGIPV